MSKPEKEELDMAVPASFDTIDDYYRENLKKILNSNLSLNSISSSIVSSDENNKKVTRIEDDDEDGRSSTTASDSELEDCVSWCAQSDQAISKVNDNCSNCALSNNTSTAASDNLQNKLQNINSVSINNSSDVHFGNKTFYNGPVTIKQIVINDDYLKKKDETNGAAVNRAFEGSSTHITSDIIKNDDDKHVNTVQNTDRKFVIVRKRIALISLVTACLLVALLSVIFFFTQIYEDEEPPKIITREEWNALPPKEALTKLELPVNRIIIAHTVGDECYTKETCAVIVREIQDMHFYDPRFNFSDIAYNFLIGGDGSIFEGRGWTNQGAHTSGYNRGSIGVAYLGTFMDKIPSDAQLKAGFRLFNEGVKINALEKNYRIFGATQLRKTDSPGSAFFELIKKWNHWSEEIA